MESTGTDEETISIELVKIMTNSKRWEDRFGALLTAQTLVEQKKDTSA